jgi:MFS family permease
MRIGHPGPSDERISRTAGGAGKHVPGSGIPADPRGGAFVPKPRIPRSIWALGFVSLLMDVSSEMIHSLLPVFMVTSLGISALVVGFIEGAAEATALVLKVFSGVISDWWGKRKPLAVLGYGLSAVCKPLFALATGAGLLITARLMDRVGKGIRGAPRDALLAMGLMLLWANDFQAVFWVATIPAALAVACLLFGVTEPERPQAPRRINPITRENLGRLTTAYWTVVGIGAVFTLARFSEAFLVLRAAEGGLPLALTPLVLVGMNVAYSLAAYPCGKLADRMNHTSLLAAGLVLLIAADAALAYSTHWTWLWSGITLWGLHMAMTQGLLAHMIADAAPEDLRGTAYGFFNLVAGVATLLASVVAGAFWETLGASVTFLAGGAFAAIALVGLLVLRPGRR